MITTCFLRIATLNVTRRWSLVVDVAVRLSVKPKGRAPLDLIVGTVGLSATDPGSERAVIATNLVSPLSSPRFKSSHIVE